MLHLTGFLHCAEFCSVTVAIGTDLGFLNCDNEEDEIILDIIQEALDANI